MIHIRPLIDLAYGIADFILKHYVFRPLSFIHSLFLAKLQNISFWCTLSMNSPKLLFLDYAKVPVKNNYNLREYHVPHTIWEHARPHIQFWSTPGPTYNLGIHQVPHTILEHARSQIWFGSTSRFVASQVPQMFWEHQFNCLLVNKI